MEPSRTSTIRRASLYLLAIIAGFVWLPLYEIIRTGDVYGAEFVDRVWQFSSGCGYKPLEPVLYAMGTATTVESCQVDTVVNWGWLLYESFYGFALSLMVYFLAMHIKEQYFAN